jgi:hypothetical protein
MYLFLHLFFQEILSHNLFQDFNLVDNLPHCSSVSTSPMAKKIPNKNPHKEFYQCTIIYSLILFIGYLKKGKTGLEA